MQVLPDGRVVIVITGYPHSKAPEKAGYVRGQVVFAGYVITPCSAEACDVVYAVTIDPGWLVYV
jgi:hypothetical protein